MGDLVRCLILQWQEFPDLTPMDSFFWGMAMTGCEAGELTEVCGPAVAGLLSLWDLMLLRVEAVRTEETYVATLCDELQALLEKVRSLASDMLKPRIVEAKEHHFELVDLVDNLPLPPAVTIMSDELLKFNTTSNYWCTYLSTFQWHSTVFVVFFTSSPHPYLYPPKRKTTMPKLDLGAPRKKWTWLKVPRPLWAVPTLALNLSLTQIITAKPCKLLMRLLMRV
uniref:Uncharacterized protein n=1 Tax=Timema poppense TaxID=170557 RepID=A0A7R9DA26_TIMPO|nr:unnamed protein product [Timema poppensis]